MRNAWPQKVINMNKLSYLKCAVFALIGLIVASAFSLTIIELMGAQTDLQFSVQRYWGKRSPHGYRKVLYSCSLLHGEAQSFRDGFSL